MSDFRANLAEVLQGQQGEKVIKTLKQLVQAEGRQKFDCQKCGNRNEVQVMDARTVLEALKWVAEQSLGKTPPVVAPPKANLEISEATDEELEAMLR